MKIRRMKIRPVITANVPCNGCTACCHGDLVFIHPECGDRVEDYETMPMTHPLTKRPSHALKHKDGSCIYLGKTGCTIHQRRPAMCREFDCRRFYLSMDRAERRRQIKAGIFSKEVVQAGRDRLHTLDEEQYGYNRTGHAGHPVQDARSIREDDRTASGSGEIDEGDGRNNRSRKPAHE